MDERLVVFTCVLFIGILAQWLAWRLKLPSILLLLAFGFLGGQFYDQSEIIESQTLFAVVSLAVGIILLEGGLTLRFSELKEAGPSVLRLVGLGSMITWGLSSLAAHYVVGFSWPVALLFAAILVVTGPTVIGPILRTVKPKRSVNSILKWEGIVIDPVGAILAVLVFGVFFHGNHGNAGFVGVVMGLGKTILIGVGLGFATATGLAYVIGKHWVPDFLQSLVVLAVSLALFTLSNMIQHESGLLTVTVIGIGLANQHRAKIRHVIEFKEVLRTALISCLFIVLGARISVQDILSVWKEALLFLLILIVVVRPASVFLSNLGSKQLTLKEQLEAHREKESCNNCHRNIDPWGLALENFDPLGQWRPSDSSSTMLPNGSEITGIEGLKQYLLANRRSWFARSVVRRLMAYTYGRSLDVGDHESVESLTGNFEQGGYRLRPLLIELICADLDANG